MQQYKQYQQQFFNNINQLIINIYMNRICLKRKQIPKKASLGTFVQQGPNENIEVQKHQNLIDLSNSPSPATKAIAQEQNNQRMFQEFRIQYDQLRRTLQAQRVSFDQISQQKKRLEIQLLNNNPQFYQKQIKRLRTEVEKLQEENQDNKHKFICAENTKKQLQATVKVRNEQLKKTLQLLEKQKISCVQFKHQLAQKQKIFQRITSQMQKSNHVLSQSFEDGSSKIQKLEFNLKTKTHDLETLQRNYDSMAKKLTQTEKTLKITKDLYEQNNTKKTQMIDQLEIKLRNLNRSSRSTIEGLETKLQQVKNQRKTENLLIDQQIESKMNIKQQRITELEIVRLEENNKQLKFDYEAKCKLVKTLQQKLLSSVSQQQYQELQLKIKELETQKERVSKEYEQKLIRVERQMENLKMAQYRNPGQQQGIKNDFQQLLKLQLEQNAKIKRQLSLKIDQVYNLKTDVEELKSKLRAGQEQVTLLNKKIKSQQKNHKIESDVNSQNLKNEIDSLKRKLDMTQAKVEHKNKEIKEKQSFIMNTIIGRSRQEDVPLIIAEMQRIFESDYSTRLVAALQKIEDLEKRTN